MRVIKKILLWLCGIAALLYIVICCFFYAKQEVILFHPTKLTADFRFAFPGNFTEKKIKTADGTMLSGMLFRADSSKGLIFYLHGNGGALDTWGEIAPKYTGLGYDMFILDYRGYGKSEGLISSEEQFYADVQTTYDSMKNLYPEQKIIVLGYSIGTGPAAMLAARNHPRMLILQAPYYSMTDMGTKEYPFLPAFLLKYKLNTAEFVQKTTSPIVIFHGDADNVIYYGSSVKLAKYFKPGDRLITLKGQGHNGITNNTEYITALENILK